MKSLRRFEHKCVRLNNEFEQSFPYTKSFDKKFEIFNNYVENFKELALKAKRHVNFSNQEIYEREIIFFTNVCQNEMKTFLTIGTAFYKDCTSKEDCLARFRKRLRKIAQRMRVSDFFSIIMITPSNTCKYKIVSLQHALNSDRLVKDTEDFIPYYSTVFDANISRIIEYCIKVRLHDVLPTNSAPVKIQ